MEWILIPIVVVAIYFVSGFKRTKIESKLKPKTKLLILFPWFILFVCYMLHVSTAKSFSLLHLFVLIAFGVAYLIYFYLRFKKIIREEATQ